MPLHSSSHKIIMQTDASEKWRHFKMILVRYPSEVSLVVTCTFYCTLFEYKATLANQMLCLYKFIDIFLIELSLKRARVLVIWHAIIENNKDKKNKQKSCKLANTYADTCWRFAESKFRKNWSPIRCVKLFFEGPLSMSHFQPKR